MSDVPPEAVGGGVGSLLLTAFLRWGVPAIRKLIEQARYGKEAAMADSGEFRAIRADIEKLALHFGSELALRDVRIRELETQVQQLTADLVTATGATTRSQSLLEAAQRELAQLRRDIHTGHSTSAILTTEDTENGIADEPTPTRARARPALAGGVRALSAFGRRHPLGARGVEDRDD